MQVRAIRRGFFDGIYRYPNVKPHCVFDCPPEAFSSSWMEEMTEGIKPLEIEKYKPLEIPALLEKEKKLQKEKPEKLSLNKKQ